MISYYYSPGSRTNKAVTEALDADLEIQRIPAFKDTKPKHAHVVLVAGEDKVSGEVERFAARLGAFPVCVPEASEWLTQQVRARIKAGISFVMVDAALATTKQLSGAK